MSKKCTLSKLLLSLALVSSISFLHIPDAKAALSWFSRANCATLNESVSWDPFGFHWLWTYTSHYQNGVLMHAWNTGWDWTWRDYAGHSDGFTLGWFVWGNHYRFHPTTGSIHLGRGIVHLGSTSAVDCNLSQM